jgi:hypothetical protein
MNELHEKPQLNIPVVSGSALIADFLGWEKYEDGITYKFPNLYPIHNIDDKENTGWISEQISNAEFHTRWDWLMPVVEKIEKEFTVKIIRYSDELSNVCEIETTDNEPLQITYIFGYDYDGKTKINVVFDAVVDFIKWWNAR